MLFYQNKALIPMKISDQILSNYELIQTEDGSSTLFSKAYGEACHSTSGAAAETRLHYIDGCKILEKDTLNILEIGFGTGLGFLETLKAVNQKFHFKFTSFEIDEDLVEYFFSKNKLKFEKIDSCFIAKNDNYELRILVGDARDQIKNLSLGYNAIYQDAFSPKRNSILWTKEWFEDLAKLATTDCIMSTYSASSSIRKSMIKAGWRIYPGDKFGPKRSSTRARLTGESDAEILAHLERSPVPMITDDNYQDYKL